MFVDDDDDQHCGVVLLNVFKTERNETEPIESHSIRPYEIHFIHKYAAPPLTFMHETIG